MHFLWTPGLIDEALSTLTPDELSALHCWQALTARSKHPSVALLKRFTIPTMAAYEANLASGLEKAKAHFAAMGITSVEALPFQTQNKSVEGHTRDRAPGVYNETKPRKSRAKSVPVDGPNAEPCAEPMKIQAERPGPNVPTKTGEPENKM